MKMPPRAPSARGRLGFAVTTAVLALAPSAGAQTVAMHSLLDGAQEPSTSSGTGQASVSVDTAANTLTFTLSFSGLTGAQTGAHIHGPAPPGMSAGILFNVGVGTPINGVWNYPEAQEQNILDGLMYFNVHTDMFPGGEIRGQICHLPVDYCFCTPERAICSNPDSLAGCANSTGSGAAVDSGGLASTTIDSLTLTASPLPVNQFGIWFMGPNQIQLPFGDGLRCVGGSLTRFAVTSSGAGGSITVGPGIASASGGVIPIGAVSTWNFQCWYRDPTGPCGNFFNVSHGVQVTWTP